MYDAEIVCAMCVCHSIWFCNIQYVFDDKTCFLHTYKIKNCGAYILYMLFFTYVISARNVYVVFKSLIFSDNILYIFINVYFKLCLLNLQTILPYFLNKCEI